uniref:Uncharacterized protein n=1 Tax=Oryza barthii TaxID=65489 RepID=A0A0D3GEQ3_9ORYZ
MNEYVRNSRVQRWYLCTVVLCLIPRAGGKFMSSRAIVIFTEVQSCSRLSGIRTHYGILSPFEILAEAGSSII